MVGKILQGPQIKSTIEETSLGQFFFNRGEKFANQICQIDATSDNSETYHSVKQRTTRLAIALQNKGVTAKDVVVTCSNNTLDSVIPIIASLYLGAKIANLDPTLSSRNIKHLLGLVSPKVIFVEESSLGLIEDSLKGTNLRSKIIVLGQSDKYSQFSDMVRPASGEEKFRPVEDIDVHDTAVMFFSSGTTGLPKAICHSHYSFLRMTEIGNDSCFNVEKMLHFTTFYWISGMIVLSQAYLEGGIRVFSRNTDGNHTFKIIEKYKLTAMFLAPFNTYQLTNVKNPEQYNVSSLRCILTGGTPMSTDQFKRLDQMFETADIIFGYGMSEIGVLSVFHPERDRDFIKTKIGSCGKPVAETSIKVTDPDTNETFGPNKKGEIRVKSSALMKGYFNLDSSSSFDDQGFLKTGDVGYYDEDGCLYVIERIKEMFKYRSWHIVPSSIEAVLLEHPAVKEAVVFGLPRGEEGEIPAACVVLKEYANVGKEEIETFVNERVSDKEKLRGGVIFVTSLPKTPSGKLKRGEVRNIVIGSS